MQIDINADLAEGFPHDEGLMQLVSSVNLACGAHAGNPQLMAKSLRLAHQLRKRIGAHPGYFDRDNFGRVERAVAPEELCQVVLYQMGALKALADDVGAKVSYIKPHGAMYHQVNRDQRLAETLVRIADQWELAIVGLPDSILEKECRKAEVTYWREGFADRCYLPDRSLVPRDQPGAMIDDPVEAVAQIHWLVQSVKVDTICIHGDGDNAVVFLKQVIQLLSESKS
ncbi:MAG: LamB/YcsF family protein [Planctomycetia bacterium]|nr:LamB/YcsF family protein [Planctomycetia bacterium]